MSGTDWATVGILLFLTHIFLHRMQPSAAAGHREGGAVDALCRIGMKGPILPQFEVEYTILSFGDCTDPSAKFLF